MGIGKSTGTGITQSARRGGAMGLDVCVGQVTCNKLAWEL